MTVLGRVDGLWKELLAARQDVNDIRSQFLKALLIARDGGYSQGNIGQHLGMTQQRVGQLEAIARRGDKGSSR